jgi:hypothetical protein
MDQYDKTEEASSWTRRHMLYVTQDWLPAAAKKALASKTPDDATAQQIIAHMKKQ